MLLSSATATIKSNEEVEAAADEEEKKTGEEQDEREAQLRELKEELARFSDDFSAMARAKSALEV